MRSSDADDVAAMIAEKHDVPARAAILVRLSLWGVWFGGLAITISTLCPIEYRPSISASADVERGLAFGILGVLLSAAYPKHRITSSVLAIGCAAVLELAQNLIPGRHGRLDDLGVKVVGVVAGVAIGAWLFKTLRCKIANRRPSPSGPDHANVGTTKRHETTARPVTSIANTDPA